jgi:DNA-binding response OmpR family regulator
MRDASTSGNEGGSGSNAVALPGRRPPSPIPKILVVDDELALVEAIAYNLRQQLFSVICANDAQDALRLFRVEKPDLVLLDVMLPSGSGFEVCRLIRQTDARVPILMLTARIAEADRVQGLEIGADDYLVKPFSMRELMARVKALLRRAGSGAASGNETAPAAEPGAPMPGGRPANALGILLDHERREARLGDKPLVLSRKEWDLLAYFLAYPDRVFDRQTLLERVWGEDAAFVDERTVDVHIRWLREKIEPNPGKPEHLLTVRGVGYKLRGG